MFEVKKPNLILASASPTRAELLENTGLSFEIRPSTVDEKMIREIFKEENSDPADIAEVLAESKAAEVAKSATDSLVIGSDQILVLEDELFEKPTTKEEAYTTLFKLRGKTHELISAIVVMENDEVIWRYCDRASLTMRDFTSEFLGTYIAHCGDEIFSSPGAYQLEALGIHLFEDVKGDYFTILGFPVVALLKMLREKGYLNS